MSGRARTVLIVAVFAATWALLSVMEALTGGRAVGNVVLAVLLVVLGAHTLWRSRRR